MNTVDSSDDDSALSMRPYPLAFARALITHPLPSLLFSAVLLPEGRPSVPLQYQQRLKETTNLTLFLSHDQQVSAAKQALLPVLL
jgi:hypothetical protein